MYRRTIIGLLGLGCLINAAALVLSWGFDEAKNDIRTGVLVRIGLLLCAIWLAWPQFKELVQALPRVVLIGGGIVLIAGVLYARLLPIVILLVAVAIGLQLIYRFFLSRRSDGRK